MSTTNKLIVVAIIILVLVLFFTVLLRGIFQSGKRSTISPTPVPTTSFESQGRFFGRDSSRQVTSLEKRINERLEDNRKREANLTQHDRERLNAFKNRLPIQTENFDIDYSSDVNQFILSKKTADADQRIQEFLEDNDLDEIFDNNRDLFAETSLPVSEYEFLLDKFANEKENLPAESQLDGTSPQSKDIQLLVDLFKTLLTFNQATDSPAGLETSPIETSNQNLFPDPLSPISPKSDTLRGYITSACLQNRQVYEQAAAATGVPWQLLGGIHFREGSCVSNRSVISGRIIGNPEPDQGGKRFGNLLESAILAGNVLKGKIGGRVPGNFQDSIEAASKYNGGGNRNCGKGVPYGGCPPSSYGEDDPYGLNFFDERHGTMYIIYCRDHVRCNPPKPDGRPGALTATRLLTGN